jgi:hypothetical protein
MASPLVWKVYNERGELVGATRYAEEAAAVLACNGDGAKVKRNGRVVYKQGAGRDCDGRAFGEYDKAATRMVERWRANHAQQRYDRLTRNMEV